MNGIVDAIRSFEGLLSLGAVSADDIRSAETELSVSFAPEYKEYTTAYGAVSFNGKEFTGAVQPLHLSVVAATRSARSITPAAGPEWYVVMDPHIDGIIIWQDPEGTIYQTEPGKDPVKVAENLESYMKMGDSDEHSGISGEDKAEAE